MQSLREIFLGAESFGTGQYSCVDNQYRRTFHGTEQRYVSPSTGRCRPLVIQAVHPKPQNINRIEVPVGGNAPRVKKLAIWLVVHPPSTLEEIPLWLLRWIWFTLALIWPFFDVPRYTGFYPTYLSRYYGQLWAARSRREYSLRTARLGVEPVQEITRSTHPRRLIIRDPDPKSTSWHICSDPNVIKQQSYIAVSYRFEDIIPRGVDKEDQLRLKKTFITKVEAVMASLHESAYWIDLTLVDETSSPEEVNQDLYRMADVYRGAQFTLIMLCPPTGVDEKQAWIAYGERLWTFPEALLSRELRFKFRDNEVTPITLHQLANRAYAHFAKESLIINSYGLRDPLERLERLSSLKSALWRRTSGKLKRLEANKEAEPLFRAEKVYALMGFFEHRIHPQSQETELQALVRLSMANDNDRMVERMVSLLPSEIPDTVCWYAEDDKWESNLWDIEPEIQVVGMTESNALVLGGCRAAAIRWKDFPSVAFATRRSVKRIIATFLPNFFWEILLIGIALEAATTPFAPAPHGAAAALVIALILMLFAPLLVTYGSSGRIVQAQPWLIGVKGLISAEEASNLVYGGAISALPRTAYSPSGTPLSRTETGQFRRGDSAQLDALRPRPNEREADDLYTLIDTQSATIYYFHAARPPTVCLFTGRESGMGRFVLCSERCTINELHKETVVRMPWYISQSMRACDWVALS
ncbi:hypothetical protein J3R83DRAFT_11404 [Lanmaoa asiatica]|nr:hypothetical protein J3R83DRAFT_11404 [Lanmaoa asiatica]